MSAPQAAPERAGVPRAQASRELLAAREDVWSFLAEPHHLPDWWPGVAAVDPDRRRLAPGARWTLRRGSRPGLLRRPAAADMLLIRDVEPPARISWHLTGDRLDAELRLEQVAPGRTRATLSVESPWLLGLRRTLPRDALSRLHALCQTAAEL